MGGEMVRSIAALPQVREYLQRIDAHERGMLTAVVEERVGHYWRDVAVIRFDRKGEIKVRAANGKPEHYLPTDAEKASIKAAIERCGFPEYVKPPFLPDENDLPEWLQMVPDEHRYPYYDPEGRTIMVQFRVNQGKGKKAYYSLTYWTDRQWRIAEPDEKLPLYNGHLIKDASIIMLHEGAKAAAYCQRLKEGRTPADVAERNAHPFGSEIAMCTHVGWIGGALSPDRTDWSPINKSQVERVYIACDNDTPGKAAIKPIAFNLRKRCYSITYTNEFPIGWDMADPFPERWFASSGEHRYYIGPPFDAFVQPATWLTDMQQPIGEDGKPNGRPKAVLREHCKDYIAHVEDADLYVICEMPKWCWPENLFNKRFSALSHIANASSVIEREKPDKPVGICYRPDVREPIVSDGKTQAINVYTPGHIQAQAGDPALWLEFMRYLVPDDDERATVLKFCATLIARPDVRIGFGLLLVSEAQGTGKTTLGLHILSPLVGKHNTSVPAEQDIMSNFNGWAAHKRLAVINEIYTGSSWAAYNRLKSLITDQYVTVNKKFQPEYTIDNWCHIVACSNSSKPIRVERDDRRWLYPTLTEVPWGKEKFDQLYSWLTAGGGLPIIKHWAEGYGDYYSAGDRAPMTSAKEELIYESKSLADKEILRIAEYAADLEEPVALTGGNIKDYVQGRIQKQIYIDGREIKRACKEGGLIAYDKRMAINGFPEIVVYNKAAHDRLVDVRNDDKEFRAGLRRYVRAIDRIVDQEI